MARMAMGMIVRRSWLDVLLTSKMAAASPATPLASAPETVAAPVHGGADLGRGSQGLGRVLASRPSGWPGTGSSCRRVDTYCDQ